MNPFQLIPKFLSWLSGAKGAQLDLAKQQHRAEIFALESKLAVEVQAVQEKAESDRQHTQARHIAEVQQLQARLQQTETERDKLTRVLTAERKDYATAITAITADHDRTRHLLDACQKDSQNLLALIASHERTIQSLQRNDEPGFGGGRWPERLCLMSAAS